MIRPASEIIFSVNGEEGALSVSAKPSIRGELENLFIRTVYKIEPPRIEIPKYNIDKLKNQDFRLVTDSKDCLKVDISFINLLWPEAEGGSTFRAKRNSDIFRTVNHIVHTEKRDLNAAEVLAVTVRFRFLPSPFRRAGFVCVEFTSNNRYIIRCKDALRTEIMIKYLKEWGIIP